MIQLPNLGLPNTVKERLLDTWYGRVKAKYPDFENFREPGDSFIRDEIGPKRRSLERFEKEGGVERVKSLLRKKRGGEALKFMQKSIKRINFVSYFSWYSVFDDDDATQAILQRMVEAADPREEGFDAVEGVFASMVEYNRGQNLDVLTTFLWLLNPQKFFPTKIKYIKKLAEEAGIGFPKSAGGFEKFIFLMGLGTEFREVLKPLRPRDWVEVQSFLWCARNATPPIQTTMDMPEEARERRYWVIAPGRGAFLWNQFMDDQVAAIGWDELGDLSGYSTRDEMVAALVGAYGGNPKKSNDSLACWQFANDIEVGDIMFAKRGQSEVLGYGVVEGDYEYRPSRDEYQNVRRVRWLSNQGGSLKNHTFPQKTLTEITQYPDFVDELKKTTGYVEPEFDEEEELLAPAPSYGREQALEDLFLTEEEFDTLFDGIKERKNIVIQGAPGVGKTFLANRLGCAVAGAKDPERVKTIQFHQSYSYDDFIQGFRPNGDGTFQLRNGPFYQFCEAARLRLDEPFVFIIDEINRGNLSKIFGELMLLIENDKRHPDYAVPLVYSDAPFYVPTNVHLIGLMNTADRSLALVDYALRRRFRFYSLQPKFDSPKFGQSLIAAGAEAGLVDTIVARLQALNQTIVSDHSLGSGYTIGHSFFCPTGAHVSLTRDWYERIIGGEVAPLLHEYWFDNQERADEAVKLLLS